MEDFHRQLAALNQAISQEGPRANTWRMRVQPLLDEEKSLQQAFKSCLQRSKVKRQRAQLFGDVKRFADEDSTEMGRYTREHSQLKHSLRNIHKYTAMTRQSLDSLQNQTATLKGAQTKMLDIANLLGLSSSLMNVISSKESRNARLVYGGMLLTLFITGIAYWYFRM
jgi:septal ring factor EnvC (AmiA/AmiB activator)